MLLPFYLALLLALLFYAGLPLVGAFLIRSEWRRFRQRVLALRGLPELHYRDIARAIRSGTCEEEGESFRLLGRLEALEGENRLWVRNAEVSALVDLSRAPLYVLEEQEQALPLWSPDRAETVLSLPWPRVGPLSEGTQLFVAGRFGCADGRPLFLDAPGEPLIVVAFEGDSAELPARLLVGGRKRNEYWNPLTRLSFALGIGGMGILLVLSTRAGYFPSVRFLALLIAVAPVLPLVPPGLAGFLAYRRLWRRGVCLRILRDLLRLDPRLLGPPESLVEGPVAPLPAAAKMRLASLQEPLGYEELARESSRASLRATALGVIALGLGLLVNLLGAFGLWRLFL